MITLCMETSQNFLTCALIQDDCLIGQIHETCLKQQSEHIFVRLNEMLKQAGVDSTQIEQVVITEGPGSYTGVRIAMTIAKVLCSMENLPCYTLNTLQLYAGNSEEAYVLLDARGGRAYFGHFKKGVAVEPVKIITIEQFEHMRDSSIPVYGDAHLIGLADETVDLPQAFLDLKNEWKKVENIHTLIPLYLKDNEAYKCA